jgi:hypothetical protein
MRLIVSLCTAVVVAAATPAAADDTPTGVGTIEGTVTTVGGLPLNGVCGVLYNPKATRQRGSFAGSGTDGTPGHYIQANVKAGKYKLLFTNCGANTNGTPDFNYVPIFYGGTWNQARAAKVVVVAGQTTTLGNTPIPLGGTVTGTVTDTTTKMGADTPPVAVVPPGGNKLFLDYSWLIVCANSAGQYTVKGAPQGSKMYFAPNSWGCQNSQGVFNDGLFCQSVTKPISITVDGTVTINRGIKETPTGGCP